MNSTITTTSAATLTAEPVGTLKRRKPPAPATLDRTTFETSRLLDFCSEKELTAQTGHAPDEWPLVILKEGMDNSLDGCEEAGTAPEIHVTVDDSGITVDDNGPGNACSRRLRSGRYCRRPRSP